VKERQGSEESDCGLGPAVAALLVTLGVTTRLAFGWEWDELQLLHAAWATGRGLVPYRDFFEHHAPLLLLALSPALGRAGDATAWLVPLRLGAAAALAGVLVCLVRLARAAVGRAAAGWAAVVFLVACPAAGKLFELRPDWPALLALLAALVLLVGPGRPMMRGFGAGLLGGLALCLTQKALVPWAAVLAWATALVALGPARRGAAVRLAALVGGSALPPAAVLAAFAGTGAGRALAEGAIGVNLDWPREVAWQWCWERASPEAAGAVALAAVAVVTRRDRVVGLLALLLGAGLLGFVTTPVPWEQAFLFLVAPWLAALAVVAVATCDASPATRRVAPWVAAPTLAAGLAVLASALALRLAVVWAGLGGIVALVLGGRLRPATRVQAALAAVCLPGLVLFAGDRLDDVHAGRGRAQAAFAARVAGALAPGEPVLALWDHVLPFRPSPVYHWFAHEGVLDRFAVAPDLEAEFLAALAEGRTRVVIADATVLDRHLPRLRAWIAERCAPLAAGYAGSDAWRCDVDDEALVRLARAHRDAGRWDETADLLRRALARVPPGSPRRAALGSELAEALAARPRVAAPSGAPNVLLVVVDTLRADHVDTYGYTRRTTPVLDALAAGGVVFENAVSQAPWTAASVATLFTGLYPSVHGLDGGPEWIGATAGPGTLPFVSHRALATEWRTLAEALASAGWSTAGFVSNAYMSAVFGLAQGFTVWDDARDDYAGDVRTQKRRGAETNRRVLDWLAWAEEPFFLLVHYNDPHWPYDPPPPFGREWTAGYHGSLAPGETGFVVEREGRGAGALSPGDVAYLVGLYDGEIAYADAQLGALLEALRARGLRRGLLTIVTGDHGEEFLEHGGTSHGYTLYDEQLRVPLVVHMPERFAARRVSAQVRLLDVAPTVLDVLGLDAGETQGASLVELAEGRTTDAPGDAFSEATLRGALAALRTPAGLKLIAERATGRTLLFDLAHDPGERHDLPPAAPDRRALAGRLTHWAEVNRERRARAGDDAASGRTVLDEATRRALRALGYLQ
jgi:arylsulfatase